jgi:rubrerythrin
MKEKEPEKLTCKRCGYRWKPRVDSVPRQCPACKTYRWNEQKRKCE